MEAIEFLKEKHRMCHSNSQDDNRCYLCPLSMSRNEYHVSCDSLMANHPEDAVRIVEQWSAENPVVTNAQKFKEVFGLDVAEGDMTRFPVVG